MSVNIGSGSLSSTFHRLYKVGPVTAAQSGIASHGRNCEIKEPESFIMVAILALCFTGSERQSELLLERQVEQENRELCPKKKQQKLLLDWMCGCKRNGKIKDDSQVFGLYFGIWYHSNGNTSGEVSSFAYILILICPLHIQNNMPR